VATTSPTVRRRRLATELRSLRAKQKKTGTKVAKDLGWSPAKISRYELGQGGFPLDEVEKLLDYYGVTDPRRAQLLDLAVEANASGWWEEYADILPPEYMEYIGLEAEAHTVAAWNNYIVPGLLQTERYARQLNVGYDSVIPTPGSILDRLVRVRMIRQELLKQSPSRQFSVVIDESVLLRQVGEKSLMRAQLRHLVKVSNFPGVELRALPLESRSSLASDSFTIFTFESRAGDAAGLADVVSTESLKSEMYVEGESQTFLYGRVFQGLVKASLTPSKTRQLIAGTAERLWS
jgi:transcriptional regulator with XRE-family HTH domain